MNRLDEYYRSPQGLNRDVGLSLNGKPDFLGIAAWIFDVYLGARLEGHSTDISWEFVTASIAQTHEWGQVHPGQTPPPPPPAFASKFNREEFLQTMIRLDRYYRAQEGLQRPQGLSLDDKPDFLGIAAWIFDYYLYARLRGVPPQKAWDDVVVQIRASHEWKQRHPRPGSTTPIPNFRLIPALPVEFSHGGDSNSPSFWENGIFHIFNSAGHPWRSTGENVFTLGEAARVSFNNEINGGRWMEAVWLDNTGVLYGWYHNEPNLLCPGREVTAPRIGAAKSLDFGKNWIDLGIILETAPHELNCETENHFFAGGNGDFSVMLEPHSQTLYFLYDSYVNDFESQGVTAARMSWSDRDAPVGKVHKWHGNSWTEPGLQGRATPFFPATISVHSADFNMFWGPSIHWNTHLEKYVMLLNRSKDKFWSTEGIYISFSSDLANPSSWTSPQKIHPGGIWYPMIVGDASMGGTDKIAGQSSRFFNGNSSQYLLQFD